MERVRIPLGLTMTCSTDSHTLLQNQVNISMSVISLVFFLLKAVKYCSMNMSRIGSTLLIRQFISKNKTKQILTTKE